MRSLGTLATLILLVAVASAVATPTRQADAGTAIATCTRNADGTFNCDKILAIGDHVSVNNSPGVCHGDVTLAGFGSGGLRTAKIRIAHNVTACPWPSGTQITINYRVVSSASVGGFAGLLPDEVVRAEYSGSPNRVAPLLAAGSAAALALAVGLFYAWGHRQRMRP